MKLLEGVPRRGAILLAALLALLIVFPMFASGYLLAVGFLILYFAYVGQAWNIMMGFAGQLSLGHSLYVGLGAYAAAALYVHFGLSPWIGLGASIALCALAGAVIGFLAFRFGVGGRVLRHPHHRLRRVRAHRLRPLRLGARLLGPVPAGGELHRERPVEPARQPADVLLPDARPDGGRLRAVPRAAAQPDGLLLARDPREPGGGAGARRQSLPLQDGGRRALRGDDLARRRGVRVLLQQPLSRADLPHLALDRAHPRPDHRRHRHAVGPLVGALLITGSPRECAS